MKIAVCLLKIVFVALLPIGMQGNVGDVNDVTKEKSMFEAQGDRFMREKQYKEALKSYQSHWDKEKKNLSSEQQVWVLLSIANAAVRSEDYEEAFSALSVLPEHYADTGIVVGNPMFHLLVGMSYHGLKETPMGRQTISLVLSFAEGQKYFQGKKAFI
ncbi:hypothetical protein [Rubellicoccus peritrichatus]|uniref:Tetratricopeptide repeat protein n=1 Tax=Rubellicoccus peritrichatus TaxID=3080537 RepID=A0AAQ3LA70_9BACT|nr:hypothetical protein [Puniceicoccus sp. CR14]WOO41666.1 hypothetical protein RZN69_01100 [Puniceicoccus sp. CR14]